jgi:nucleoside-diphosphate-sugar epimerase
VRIKEWRLERLSGKEGFEFSRSDITDPSELERVFSGSRFDVVINLAARAGVRQSVEDPASYYETNLMGTLHLLELCRRKEVPKLVLASTSSVYGGSKTMPFKEDETGEACLSPYAASKESAETLVRTYHILYGLDVTVLRYFTVYGPAGRPDMSVFRFIQKISEGRPITVFGDGTQKRDFTFVEDIAEGTLAAIPRTGFDTINLGSDRPAVLNDVIRRIEALVGSKASRSTEPAHPADVPATWADISRARTLLGWEPRTSIEDGLKACVEWYQANRSWAKEIKT